MLKYLAALALIVGITLATPQSAFAGGKGKGGGKKKEAAPQNHTTVSEVSSSSITVASLNSSRSYTIDKNASIRVNGYAAPISEVKVGMRVMVGANSKGEAQTIAAYAAPAPEKGKGASKGKSKGK